MLPADLHTCLPHILGFNLLNSWVKQDSGREGYGTDMPARPFTASAVKRGLNPQIFWLAPYFGIWQETGIDDLKGWQCSLCMTSELRALHQLLVDHKITIKLWTITWAGSCTVLCFGRDGANEEETLQEERTVWVGRGSRCPPALSQPQSTWVASWKDNRMSPSATNTAAGRGIHSLNMQYTGWTIYLNQKLFKYINNIQHNEYMHFPNYSAFFGLSTPHHKKHNLANGHILWKKKRFHMPNLIMKHHESSFFPHRKKYKIKSFLKNLQHSPIYLSFTQNSQGFTLPWKEIAAQ